MYKDLHKNFRINPFQGGELQDTFYNVSNTINLLTFIES